MRMDYLITIGDEVSAVQMSDEPSLPDDDMTIDPQPSSASNQRGSASDHVRGDTHILYRRHS